MAVEKVIPTLDEQALVALIKLVESKSPKLVAQLTLDPVLFQTTIQQITGKKYNANVLISVTNDLSKLKAAGEALEKVVLRPDVEPHIVIKQVAQLEELREKISSHLKGIDLKIDIDKATGKVSGSVTPENPDAKKKAAAYTDVIKGLHPGTANAYSGLSNTISKAGEALGFDAEAIAEVTAAAGPAAVVVGAVALGFETVNKVVSGTISTVKQLYGELDLFAGGAKNLVEAVNPGLVSLYSYALKDVDAVIGQRLVPVMQAWIGVIYSVGDTITSILPATEDVRNAISILAPAMTEILDAIDPLIPLIKDYLVDVMYAAAFSIKAFVDTITLIPRAIKPLLSLLPGGSIFADTNIKAGSSFGAGARPAEFISAEDIGRRAQLGAFSQGAGDPLSRIADNSDITAALLKDLKTFVGFIKGSTIDISVWVQAIGEVFGGSPQPGGSH